MEEVFSPSTVRLFNNSTLYKVHETFSQFSGFCYTTCYLPKSKELKSFHISLNTRFDVKVFLHESGTEIWLSGFHTYPFQITKATIDSSNNDGFVGVVVGLKEIEQIARSRTERPCKSPDAERKNDIETFNECAQQSFQNILNSSKEYNCKVLEMDYFLQEVLILPTCHDEETAKLTFWMFCEFLNNFSRNPSAFACSLPCKQLIYATTIDYYHNNLLGHSGLEKGFFNLAIQYSTINVEEQIENLEYDLGNLLVSTGGNLGLFLGFSCLSLLFSLVNAMTEINKGWRNLKVH